MTIIPTIKLLLYHYAVLT